jgi:hypothetical protein
VPELLATVKEFEPIFLTRTDWPVDTWLAGGNSSDKPVVVAVTSMILLAGVPVLPLTGHWRVVFELIEIDS